jgi:hypothetical protein
MYLHAAALDKPRSGLPSAKPGKQGTVNPGEYSIVKFCDRGAGAKGQWGQLLPLPKQYWGSKLPFLPHESRFRGRVWIRERVRIKIRVRIRVRIRIRVKFNTKEYKITKKSSFPPKM